MKGKLWFWGSYGKQDIKAGIVGFFLPDANCQAMKAALAARPARAVLDRGRSRVPGHRRHRAEQLQLEIQLGAAPGTTSSRSRTRGPRSSRTPATRPTRVPIETTFRQKAVPSAFGTFGWDVGPIAVLEGERPARHQRSLARRRAVGASRQQLRARLPRGRPRERAADVRHLHRRLGTIVPALGPVHPSDATAST